MSDDNMNQVIEENAQKENKDKQEIILINEETIQSKIYTIS